MLSDVCFDEALLEDAACKFVSLTRILLVETGKTYRSWKRRPEPGEPLRRLREEVIRFKAPINDFLHINEVTHLRKA